MSQNNRARRAAKAKSRQKGSRRARPDGTGSAGPGAHPFGDPDGRSFRPRPGRAERPGPEALWRLLEDAARGNDPALPHLAARVVQHDAVRGDRVAEQVLTSYVDQLWRTGWQPREVVRQARRKATKAAGQLVELAIHADHERRTGQAADPRWTAQLAELGERDIPTRDGWLHLWRARHGHDAQWTAVQVARAMAAIGHLPVLDVLIPPPGSSARTTVRGVPVTSVASDDPVLRRVRKLLAKAESTEFDHEADSLTAKAHELMTKHAIDRAVLLQAEPSDRPYTMRVPIDAPYADGKSLLLQVVASGQRCRAVFHTGLDMSSVVGHPDDLQAVELVFTSLLVQAQHALASHARGAGARTRSASYKSAFYVSFAHRIGERLATVTEEVMALAGDGAHLPVLRAREEAVEEAFDERYAATLTSSAVRNGYDPLGHAHGRQAADAARFGSDAITA